MSRWGFITSLARIGVGNSWANQRKRGLMPTCHLTKTTQPLTVFGISAHQSFLPSLIMVSYPPPPHLLGLEHFVCRVYCMSGPTTNLPSLRWEMFRTRNLEGESLPPTRATLLPRITCANYIAMRDKSYTTNCPVLPPIYKSGWLVKGILYKPVMCLDEPAPKAVIELTKCSCKTGCVCSRCTVDR